MATLANVIKKAEKTSGQKIQKNDNNEHWVEYKGYTISFFPNGRLTEDCEATCFYASKHKRTVEDVQTDYFPGAFFENIKQSFDFVERMVK